jgi:hypothetical protein
MMGLSSALDNVMRLCYNNSRGKDYEKGGYMLREIAEVVQELKDEEDFYWRIGDWRSALECEYQKNQIVYTLAEAIYGMVG